MAEPDAKPVEPLRDRGRSHRRTRIAAGLAIVVFLVAVIVVVVTQT